MNPTESSELPPSEPARAPSGDFSEPFPSLPPEPPPPPSPPPESLIPIERGLKPSLSLALSVRTLGLLFGEGMSVGLFAWAMASGPSVLPYALDNQVPLRQRALLLGAMFGTGILWALIAVAYLGFAKRPSLSRLHQIALRLAPLFLVGFLPFLFTWQLWQARELTHAVLVTLLAFGAHAAVSAFLRAEPLFSRFSVRWSRTWSRVGRKLEPWLPSVIVGIGVLGYGVYFAHSNILSHRSLRGSIDLAVEENLIWNLIHGGGFMKSSPLAGPVGSRFGDQATLFAYVMGSVYAFYQRPETLLVLQAFLIGLGALPLYWLGRRYVGSWAAAIIALVYLLYPPVHASNLQGFHYLPLGVLFLFLTVWLVESGRYRWAALSVALALSIREDVAVALIVIGAYLIFSGRSTKGGLAIAGAAVAYLLLLRGLVMPRWLPGGAAFVPQPQISPPGDVGYGVVLKAALENPILTLTNLLEERKLLYVVQLGAPLAFLPWRRPIGWLCTLPGLCLVLLSTSSLLLQQTWLRYAAHWTALFFVAVLANLAWLRRPAFPGDTLGAKRQHAWLAAIGLLSLFMSYQYGAVLQQKTAKGAAGAYVFGATDEDRLRYQQLSQLIAQVPPRAKIVSSEKIVPHVASRPNSYALGVGVFDAQYLLASLAPTASETTALREALSSGFGVLETDGEFVLAKRGHSEKKNPDALSRIR